MKIGKSFLSLTWGDIPISANKSFEYQLELFGDSDGFTETRPFEFRFEITRKTDHAGASFIWGIRKLFWIHLNVHDHRHWNNKANRWALPGEPEEDDYDDDDENL